MKKLFVLALIGSMALGLIGCEKTTDSKEDTQVVEENSDEASKEAEDEEGEEDAEMSGTDLGEIRHSEATPEKLSGPWHLDPQANDFWGFDDIYSGYSEFGARMEIRSNGLISWGVGAVGGTGEYLIDGEQLIATINPYDGAAEEKDIFTIKFDENGNPNLELEYDGNVLYWVQGEGSDDDMSDGSADPVTKPYGYTEGPDTVKLVNRRGDETTAYKLADGRYMDRITMVYIYDGKETWTDSDGVEWNQALDCELD